MHANSTYIEIGNIDLKGYQVNRDLQHHRLHISITGKVCIRHYYIKSDNKFIALNLNSLPVSKPRLTGLG